MERPVLHDGHFQRARLEAQARRDSAAVAVTPRHQADTVVEPPGNEEGAAFADRRTGVGLYAFAESDRPDIEDRLKTALAAANGPKPPEHLQAVAALPRDASGNVRTEILQLVAMNQVDLIPPLLTTDTDRALMRPILDARKNLRDRFSF